MQHIIILNFQFSILNYSQLSILNYKIYEESTKRHFRKQTDIARRGNIRHGDMGGSRTISRTMVDTVGMFCHIHLSHDRVEQQQCTDTHIQPYGVVLVHHPIISDVFSVLFHQSGYCRTVRHCILHHALPMLSGPSGRRTHFLRIHLSRTGKYVLRTYLILRTGCMVAHGVLSAIIRMAFFFLLLSSDL